MYAILFLLSLLLAATAAQAQTTDPRTLPAVQPGDIAYLGSFKVPSWDGTGTPNPSLNVLDYGGTGIGVSTDGKSLFYGCHDYSERVARISIPALGGTASIIEPCRDVPGVKNLAGVNPNGVTVHGTFQYNGRVLVSANTYYSDQDQVYTHWVGSSLSTLGQPQKVSGDFARKVAGKMTLVSPEWRALLGYPALTGQCCLSIVSASLLGPGAYGFDPDKVGTPGATAKMLFGYDINHQTNGTYDDPGGFVGFGNVTTIAGYAQPAGTSSLLAIGTQGGRAKACYGAGTLDPALDMKSNGLGHVYCYDPFSQYQGPHGYPYIPALWIFPMQQLAEVAAGTRQPWNVKQTSITRLPGPFTDSNFSGFTSAAYDPTTRRIYATIGLTVHVWEVKAGTVTPPPPPIEVCGDGIDNDGDGQVDEGCAPPPPADKDCVTGTPKLVSDNADTAACVAGVRTIIEQWTRIGDVQATGNGKACSAIPYETTRTEPCALPPPPPSFEGRLRAQSLVTAGLRLTLEVPATVPVPAKGATVWVNLGPGDPVPATVFDVDLAYYAGTPRGTRVILTVPSASFLTVKTFTTKP